MTESSSAAPKQTILAVRELLSALRNQRWLGTPEDGKPCLSFFIPHLLAGLGWRGPVERIALAMPYKSDRLDLVGLLNTIAHLGWSARPTRQRLDCIDHRLLPVVFVPEGPSAQQLGPLLISKSTDPDQTNDMVCFRNKDQSIEPIVPKGRIFGSAYIFSKPEHWASGDAAGPKRTALRSWFGSIVERFRSNLTQIFILSLILNVISLATPIFIMLVYDVIIGGLSINGLAYLILGVGLAICVEFALRFLRLRSVAWLGSRVDHMVGVGIFGRLLHLPPMYTERSSVSGELARIRAFEALHDFFTSPTLLVILELPFVVVLLVCIAFLGGPIATIPIVMAAFYISFLLFVRPKLRQAIWSAAKANSEKEKLLVETFSKIEGMRFNGIDRAWLERFREVSAKTSHGSFRSAFLASVIETMAHGLAVLAGFATIAFGVGRIWDGEMTVGALIASLILVWRVLSPLQTLCLMLPRIEQLWSSIGQVNRLMELEPEHEASISPPSRKSFKGQILFTNVGLRYSKSQDPVFAGLTISIEPGDLVAVTGSNGAGKTTVLKLVNRLCVPQAGSIRIDGADIRQLDPVELRRNITYVSEDPVLFHGTIADNLRLANPLSSDQVLKEALIQADGWDEVSTLPDQLDTLLVEGESGGLSSGFAYRINLARAYLQDNSIMLVDEMPFSLLNSRTGEAYKAFLKANKGKRTTLIVTYRDDYLELADKVIYLAANSRPVIGAPSNSAKLDQAA